MEVSSTAPRRGRVVPSRYMDATASSRAATASISTGRKPITTAQEKASMAPTSVRRTLKSNVTESTHLSKKKHAPPEAPAARQRAVTSNTGSQAVSGVPGKHSRPPVQISLGAKATTALELEIASQIYAWIFMRHTLTESSNAAVAEFEAKFAAHLKEFKAEEKVLAESRIRYQAEKETQMLDDLSSQHLYRVVPNLIRTFVLSQEMCQVAIVNATRLQGTDWETVCAIRSGVRELDQLTGESNDLRKSIAALFYTLAPESLLGSTLEGLLPVLDMRLANLALSRKLLTTIRDNATNLQHLESLRVYDSGR